MKFLTCSYIFLLCTQTQNIFVSMLFWLLTKLGFDFLVSRKNCGRLKFFNKYSFNSKISRCMICVLQKSQEKRMRKRFCSQIFVSYKNLKKKEWGRDFVLKSLCCDVWLCFFLNGNTEVGYKSLTERTINWESITFQIRNKQYVLGPIHWLVKYNFQYFF